MNAPFSSIAIRRATLVACLALGAHAHGAVTLGTAAPFLVLAGSTVTNTGTTEIDGDVGVDPGLSITGFPDGTITGTFHTGDAVAQQAQADALIAYNYMASLPFDMDLTGQDLGGKILTPGVYYFSSSAQLTGPLPLTLSGAGEFIFRIVSTFTSASNSEIITMGGADPSQVYFQVGTSATLGTNSQIIGTIIANQSVTLTTGASLVGRAIALNGAVTLDSNTIIPEPSSAILVLSGLVSLLTLRRRSR